MDDIQLAASPTTDPGTLRDIAERTPAARPLIAVHPNIYPDLLEWLGSLGDPAVDSALGRRSAPGEVAEVTATQRSPARMDRSESGKGSDPTPATATADSAMTWSPATAGATNGAGSGRPVGRRRRSRVGVAVGVLIGLLCAGAAAVLVLPEVGGPSWWPWGGSDAAPGEGTLIAEPASFTEGARVAWTVNAADLVPARPDIGPAIFDLGIVSDNEAAQFLGTRVIDADTVWIATVGYRSSLYEGTPQIEGWRTVALDVNTGEVAWEGAFSSCEIASSEALVCYDGSSGEAALIDTESGASLWRSKSGSPQSAVSNGVVVFCAVGEATGVDLETGDFLWRAPTLVEGGHFLECQASDGLFSSRATGAVTIMDSAGSIVAQSQNGGLGLVSGRVLDTSDGSAEIFDASLVDARESTGYLNAYGSGEALYYLSWRDDGAAGVDPLTGAELWYEEGVSPSFGGVLVAERDGAVRLAIVREADLLLIDPSGESPTLVASLPEWMIAVGARVFVSGDLGDGVIAMTADGRMLAVDALTGRSLWEMDVPGTLTWDDDDAAPVIVSTDRMTLSRVVPARPAGTGGVVSVDLPDDLPECPGDTIQLARAELPNGWVLVCGYYADQPTYFAVHSESTGDLVAQNAYTEDGQLVTEAVTFDATNGRYSGTMGDGSQVWLEHTPATLGVRNSEGVTTVQEAAVYVFFVELGEGGAAQGVGAYDVAAPDRTAESQVAYFSEILRRSEEARAELGPAVGAVRQCTEADGDYSAQIATITSVRDNRSELLAAIQAAPVDLVPDGTQLVDELSAALRVSYDADVAYLAAAERAQTYGCDVEAGDFGSEYTELAASTKTTFAEHWNRLIAPEFGVPEVYRETL